MGGCGNEEVKGRTSSRQGRVKKKKKKKKKIVVKRVYLRVLRPVSVHSQSTDNHKKQRGRNKNNKSRKTTTHKPQLRGGVD